jgi:hypothetical protein
MIEPRDKNPRPGFRIRVMPAKPLQMAQPIRGGTGSPIQSQAMNGMNSGDE